MAIVYQHRRCDTNEIFYIGIGKEEKRAYNKYRNNKHWRYIVNKVGLTVEIIHKEINWEEACCIEKYLIRFYGRKDLGFGNLVNRTDGGDGAINPNLEIRKKMSEAHKGIKLSKEHRVKLSEAKKGKKTNPCTKENKLKISESLKGKKHSEERVKKVSESNRGKKHSEETKIKMSEASKGVPQKIIKCPHCYIEGGNKTMKRWHFDNCKQK